MVFESFFARRILFKHQRDVSGLVVRLVIISIAVAVAVMEISLSVVQGFEWKIQDKVVGFGSHIQIGNYFSLDEEKLPIAYDTAFVNEVKALEAVEYIGPFVNQWALLDGKKSREGVNLRGVDSLYDWSFFKESLLEGNVPTMRGRQHAREILISKTQSKKLQLDLGDKVTLYFLDDPMRRRSAKVTGIYQTGMEEFDENIALVDIRMLQGILKWNPDQIEGFDINLHELSTLGATVEKIDIMSNNLSVTPITFIFPEIFEWLELLHNNVYFILALMIIVALINMVSVVLILIIERTRTIGVLKALGLPDGRLMMLFSYNAFFIILTGLILGNILGLGLLFLQDQFEIISLPQESYFVKTVPVAWVWPRFMWVNLGVIVVCTVFTLLPTRLATRVKPIQAIRFD
ncbi:MAG: ABC transporter permease [Bacteroidia bacterium]